MHPPIVQLSLSLSLSLYIYIYIYIYIHTHTHTHTCSEGLAEGSPRFKIGTMQGAISDQPVGSLSFSSMPFLFLSWHKMVNIMCLWLKLKGSSSLYMVTSCDQFIHKIHPLVITSSREDLKVHVLKCRLQVHLLVITSTGDNWRVKSLKVGCRSILL